MKYLPLFFLLGCAPLTELQKEEREYSHAVAKENWIMCNALYEKSGVYTVHSRHTHGKRDRITIWDYRDDLRAHDCKRLLGDAWAEE